jgi:hypothetical protein
MSNDLIPTTPEAITPEWLTDVLGVPVRVVSTEMVGTGQMGDSVRLTLEYDDPTAASPWSLVAKLPFQVEVVQTDNGAEFQGAFHWHLLDRGIGHVYIKVKTPRLNGKVERSHRIDAEEFYRLLDGVVIDTAEVFNQKLQEWEDFYNFNRPHGGLNGQTPYDRLRQKTTTPA